MNFSEMKSGKSKVVLTLALAASITIAAKLRADDKKPEADANPSQLSEEMIGTWVLAGIPGAEGERPEIGSRLKFFTGKHWTITQADEDGKVIFHHGGSYTLDGDEYTETIEYANENTASMIGQTFKFKIKIDGDKYSQEGVGNPFTEDWKRAK